MFDDGKINALCLVQIAYEDLMMIKIIITKLS